MARFSASLLLGLAAGVHGAALQVGAEAEEWGDAVDGVQMRVALDLAGQPALPGELPALAIQIRNQVLVDVALRSDAILFARIEVDGVWYEQPVRILHIRPLVGLRRAHKSL